MWKELVSGINPGWTLLPAARPGEVAEVERALGIRLPDDLSGLLLETDGVLGDYDLGLVWPARRIRDDNLHFRSYPDFAELYMPFDPLLFFGDAGNGDQFAFRILAGVVRYSDVYVWNHESDNRTWVAPSLRLYLEWWNTGKIRV
jgi:SMI1-KNR4 cell-wall